MFRSFLCFALVSAQFVTALPAHAQFAGSRGGNEGGNQGQFVDGSFDPPPLDPKVAVSYITLDGRAETRVRPSEIRIVLAVTAEADSAAKCQQAAVATIDRLKAAWAKMKDPPKDTFVDFIAILPRFTWSLEKLEGSEVGVEKKSGYHIQSNVHLAVADNAQAEAALAVAFGEGVTDIIAFDYWSRDLDEIKAKVRQEAVKAARAKADTLLSPLFDGKLPIINVQEKTTVRYPDSMYVSFRASYEETFVPSWRNNNVAQIRADRPRNTYYRGLNTDGDIQPRELPMRPEISVVSTVRLYFRSPGADVKKDTPIQPEK
jgi:uncharacterized protein YggE